MKITSVINIELLVDLPSVNKKVDLPSVNKNLTFGKKIQKYNKV